MEEDLQPLEEKTHHSTTSQSVTAEDEDCSTGSNGAEKLISSEENQDNAVFEIVDYSTASNWEKFVSEVEITLRNWFNQTQETSKEGKRGLFFSKKLFYDGRNLKLCYFNLNQYAIDDLCQENEGVKYHNLNETKPFNYQKKLLSEEMLHCPTKFKNSNLHLSIGRSIVDTSRDGTETTNQNNILPPPLSSNQQYLNQFGSVGRGLLNENMDFSMQIGHNLQKWFGVSEFLVLTTDDDENGYTNANQARILLSALAVSLDNSKICSPVFVQIGSPSDDVYLGRYQTKSEVIKFRVDSTTNEIPPLYTHLSGLLDMFSLCLGKQAALGRNIQISARFMYCVPNMLMDDDNRWRDIIYKANDKSPIYLLDWGSIFDPVDKLCIYCRWPSFSESSLNTVHSDLMAEDAPFWSLKCIADNSRNENIVKCELSETLKQFTEMYYKSLKEVAEGEQNRRMEFLQLNVMQAIKKLAPLSTNENFVMENSSSKSSSKSDSMKNQNNEYKRKLQEELRKSLEAIFDFNVDQVVKPERDLPKSFSSPGCILSLLSVQMALLDDWNDIKYLWMLFVGFIRSYWEKLLIVPNVTFSSESFKPDWSTSLIEQKLTMLNACIAMAKRVEQRFSKSSESQSESKNTFADEEGGGWESLDVNEFSDDNKPEESEIVAIHPEESKETHEDMTSIDVKQIVAQIPQEIIRDDDSLDSMSEGSLEENDGTCEDYDDDEFQDAKSEDEASDIQEKENMNEDNHDEDMKDRKGCLKKLGDYSYGESPKRQIYIPKTQDIPPMTEDMVSMQQKILSNLGSSQGASTIRARMQSTTLQSDMQAFKAANPGCGFEDFLKWYSPRDIDSENESNGKTVSNRMKNDNNLWVSVWDLAQAIPADEQKPLFDYIREAELALHYLETLTVDQWMYQMLFSAYVTGYYTLKHAINIDPVLPKMEHLHHLLSHLQHKMNGTLRGSSILPEKLQDLYQEFERVEHTLSLATSLKNLLECASDRTSIIDKLCSDQEAFMETDDHKEMAKRLIRIQSDVNSNDKNKEHLPQNECKPPKQKNKKDTFMKPTTREYIFRCIASRPYVFSSPSPHKMHTSISKDGFKVCLALSSSLPF